MGFLLFILIGLAAGWIAGVLVKGDGFGLLGNLAVGAGGAVIGGILATTFGFFAGAGILGGVILATVGAVILLFFVRLIHRA